VQKVAHSGNSKLAAKERGPLWPHSREVLYGGIHLHARTKSSIDNNNTKNSGIIIKFVADMEKWVVSNDLFFADVVASLQEGRTVTIPVKGYSMLPFIRGGKDLVELEIPSEPLKPYDIVLFHVGTDAEGKWIMHRILKVDGDNLTIQGDGVTRGREHVKTSQVKARAKTIIRAGKTPVDPYSKNQIALVKFWNFFRPLRPFILKAYRMLPWNYKWLKENR
jgi:hypothetical protein